MGIVGVDKDEDLDIEIPGCGIDMEMAALRSAPHQCVSPAHASGKPNVEVSCLKDAVAEGTRCFDVSFFDLDFGFDFGFDIGFDFDFDLFRKSSSDLRRSYPFGLDVNTPVNCVTVRALLQKIMTGLSMLSSSTCRCLPFFSLDEAVRLA